jgi:hypothetical protein
VIRLLTSVLGATMVRDGGSCGGTRSLMSYSGTSSFGHSGEGSCGVGDLGELPINANDMQKKVWFELFCVPVVPMSSKHIWVCGVCQFQAKQQPGYVCSFPYRVLLLSACCSWQPALPGQHHQNGGGHMMMQGPPPGGYQGPSPGAQSGAQAGYPGHQQGYQPAYR